VPHPAATQSAVLAAFHSRSYSSFFAFVSAKVAISFLISKFFRNFGRNLKLTLFIGG
jgi:hypothetical protein